MFLRLRQLKAIIKLIPWFMRECTHVYMFLLCLYLDIKYKNLLMKAFNVAIKTRQDSLIDKAY